MTSYDDRGNLDDLDPSYGIHLHDPRMMEYMGAPESARLLGRSPEYWLEHMGRENGQYKQHNNCTTTQVSL